MDGPDGERGVVGGTLYTSKLCVYLCARVCVSVVCDTPDSTVRKLKEGVQNVNETSVSVQIVKLRCGLSSPEKYTDD